MLRSAFLTLCFVMTANLAIAADTQTCDRLVVSGHPDYPPFQWQDGKVINGASIEAVRRIMADAGVAMESRYVGPWKRVLHAAEMGRIDLVVSLKKKAEREVFMDFTNSPFFDNPFAIFVHKDRTFPFNEWKDLEGRKGGANLGDRFGTAFDAYIDESLSVERAVTAKSSMQKLMIGRIDYFIHGLYIGRTQARSYGFHKDLVALAKPVNTGMVHHGFSKKSPCRHLIPVLDDAMKRMMESGETGRIVEYYTSQWQGGGS